MDPIRPSRRLVPISNEDYRSIEAAWQEAKERAMERVRKEFSVPREVAS